MSKNTLKIRVANLYPDILQGFSDDTNIDAFYLRSKWRGIEVEINDIKIGEKVQSLKYDFFYIGGSAGSINSTIQTAFDNLKRNETVLYEAAVSKVPILAVNLGYILLGNSYSLFDNKTREGLKILDIESFAGKKLAFNYTKGTCPFLNNETIVGFENHSMTTNLKENVRPFFIVDKGFGNNNKDKTHGARFYNVIGSYITSPLLAQNPVFCDFLISQALNTAYKNIIHLKELYDDVEFYSHNYILETK